MNTQKHRHPAPTAPAPLWRMMLVEVARGYVAKAFLTAPDAAAFAQEATVRSALPWYEAGQRAGERARRGA